MKLKLLLINLFLFTLTLFSQEYADKIDALFNDTNAPTRGKINNGNDGFSLFYFDKYEKDSHVKFLQDKGFHGGGASWLPLIYTAFNIYEDNLIDHITNEIEVSGITFKSKNKEELQMISKVIGLIKTDENVLNSLIKEAEKLKIMK